MSRRQQTDRERIELMFKTNDEAECEFLLYMAGVIFRSRFQQKDAPAKRGRKAKPQPAQPLGSVIPAGTQVRQ